ncbi:MAG: methyltransferase domain-containing protein [Oscillospiraceae bacterium]|jgi:SAM-dependent methyltransferase|nr:methyltransferase domain-containing protein [Oscillospiraceae bacterium]
MIINKDIDKGKAFDWGRTSSDYAKYRDIYPDEFYQKIIEMGLCVKGQRILDLGTGTGVLPRNLYKYGAEFVGADISENQIEQARLLTKDAEMDIDYVVASAENFEFPDNCFDVVTACQCFQYFDKTIALPRIHKVLKENGHFCILFMAWLTDECEIAKHSEELVLKYNPDWTGGGMKRYTVSETPEWAIELFEATNFELFDVNVKFTRESWHGRIKACRGIGASSLSTEEISAFEKEHLEYLHNVPDIFDILHYVTILNLRKKHI